MNILVLGANGFIGGEVVRALTARGHDVKGLVRTRPAASCATMQIVEADIARLTMPADWRNIIEGIDAVVNCSGALQTGARDSLASIQRDAIIALIDAAGAAGITLFVQVSAPLEGAGSNTEFLETKRAADEYLAGSRVPHVILRPALVLGRNCHGGSALIRALAALPFAQPVAFADTPVRIVALRDVASAVADALDGTIVPYSDLYLAHERRHTLAGIVSAHRSWLGLGRARIVAMPDTVAGVTARFADLLGLLGWRSPMRSTAMIVAGGGIATEASSSSPLDTQTSLETLLASEPAGAQDLWFARLYLLKPAIFAVLSLFWFLTGLVALVGFETARNTAIANNYPQTGAGLMVVATALTDILIGAGIAIRRWSRPALIASVLVSLAYLAAASWYSPGLWLAPLGPLMKTIPAIILSGVALAIFEERA